jgi:hypothetical protein
VAFETVLAGAWHELLTPVQAAFNGLSTASVASKPRTTTHAPATAKTLIEPFFFGIRMKYRVPAAGILGPKFPQK